MNHLPPKKQIILGIDPGTYLTGYAFVSVDANRQCSAIDFGCIRPPAKEPLSVRYLIIFRALETLIKKYSPEAMAVETQYIHKNPQSGLKLGMARGIAVLAASLREIPIFEYAPSRAKKAVVGNGNASKEQVQSMVKFLLSLSELPQPQDAADALALAICHAQAFNKGTLL